MASPSRRVLITGIGGFTGRWLAARLTEAGYRVFGLTQEPAQTPAEIQADLGDPPALRAALEIARPDYIVHLAAITFVPHGDSAEIYRVNLFGTLNLLDAILAVGLQPLKVLVASSANVYGNPSVEVIDETVCPAPVNHYANSKLAMEHMARTYDDRLPLVITRPFNYTGAGQAEHFLIPKIVAHYRARRPIIELGNLDVVRDFSAVAFVVNAYQKLLECPDTDVTVNICSGRGTALGEIIAFMNGIAGYAIDVTVNPAFVRTNEIRRLIGSNHKLFSLIGEQPIPGIRDLLAEMYRAPA
ncbi:MAG TPA: GDP-mannose 4,6-dehydratase [Candidatus Competibacter sp.]|nr:GDP-mannose 4,6-dehydratase [Candidatus Competibacter sp.]